MYNPYYSNPQISIDNIDRQIRELEGMRNKITSQQPAINQTFQIAPNQSGVRIVGGVEDVKRELVFTDSVFVNKTFDQMWIKSPKGDIRPFSIKEIVEKDEKDILIDNLRKEIEELKGKDNNGHIKSDDDKSSAE